MNANLKHTSRRALAICAVASITVVTAPAAMARKSVSDATTPAMIADNPMSALNPFNGGADPVTMPGDARIGVFPYSRDQIYRVLTAPLKLTTIELEKGEKLIADPAMGDSIQW